MKQREAKKIARGRGNQGDWITPSIPIGVLSHYKTHNDLIDMIKELKKRIKTETKIFQATIGSFSSIEEEVKARDILYKNRQAYQVRIQILKEKINDN